MKKNRDLESVFIVEGDKMVREIISDWPGHIICLCTTNEQFKSNTETYCVSVKEMNDMSTLHTSSSLLAVVKKPKHEANNPRFILAIDGVQDPGNMGTIIRTADWFGVDQIVCSNETVDVFNSKVIQSSMGSLFRIPIVYTNLSTYLNNTPLPIYGALLEGSNMYETELSSEAVVLVGNEGNGISEKLRPFISDPILIPGKGHAESLNVAVATGIILSEFAKS